MWIITTRVAGMIYYAWVPEDFKGDWPRSKPVPPDMPSCLIRLKPWRVVFRNTTEAMEDEAIERLIPDNIIMEQGRDGVWRQK